MGYEDMGYSARTTATPTLFKKEMKF